MGVNFAQLLASLPPGWARDTALKRAWLQLFAKELDGLLEDERQGVAARFPTLAPDDALGLLGAERSLQQFPGEYEAAWRNRVMHAFDFWDEAGTLPGMTHALEALGYTNEYGRVVDAGNTVEFTARDDGTSSLQVTGVTDPVDQGVSVLMVDGVRYEIDTYRLPLDWTYYASWAVRIVEHYVEDRSIWAEFSVYLTATRPEFTTDAWDDGSTWDDDSAWDVPLGAHEGQRIVGIINEIKPAHAKLRRLYYVPFPKPDFWDDGSTWDDGSVWDLNNAIQLYP